MKIYNYHPEYNHYVGESIADESPLEPGIYLIPAHATTISIPDYDEGTVPVFNGSEWEVITDKRGTWYDTSTSEEITVYNPQEEVSNLTRIKPPSIEVNQKLSWSNNQWVIEDLPPPPPLFPPAPAPPPTIKRSTIAG